MREPFLSKKVLYTLALCLPLVVVGCTSLPAQPPPQLVATPGAFVVVDERTVKTPTYRVDAPAGWKIVKSSIAADPIVLVFASPDNSMSLSLSDAPLTAQPPESSWSQQETHVTLDGGQTLYLVGWAQPDSVSAFREAFEQVRLSIRLSGR